MFSRVEDILTKNPTIPQSRVEDLLVQLMEGLPTDEHIRDLVGSPLKADTVSEMTDDTKIYIYTGSETGYTAGHWYYYNGSSWTDGGVYNSAGINTDKTLSVEDKAADGKAVGDELSDLKSDLSELEGDVETINANMGRMSEQKTTSSNNDDLDISDSNGNVLMRIVGGHVKTKNFDSSNINPEVHTNVDSVSVSGNQSLDIADLSGNVILRLSDGHIKTRKFDSATQFVKQRDTYARTVSYSGSMDVTFDMPFSAGDNLMFHVQIVGFEKGGNIGSYAISYYAVNALGQETLLCSDYGYNYPSVVLANDAEQIKMRLPSGLTWGSTRNIRLIIYRIYDNPIVTRTIKVKPDGSGDYTTIRAALDSITDNDVMTRYVVEVYPGTYNILSDYTQAEIEAEDFYGPMIGNGTLLRGVGQKDDIIINGTLSTTTYDSTTRNTISALNIIGSACGIENMTILADHIRYCIHDDFSAPVITGMEPHTLKDLVLHAHDLTSNGDTYQVTYGAGFGTGKNGYFENVDFGDVCLVHGKESITSSPFLHFKDCKARIFSCSEQEATEPMFFTFDNCKATVIRMNMKTAQTQTLRINGAGTDCMVDCYAGAVYDIAQCHRFERTYSFSVGQAVKIGQNYNLSVTADKANMYGIVLGKLDGYTYVQSGGYINSNTFGISGLSVGDYLTLDSNGIITDGGTASNAIGVVISTNTFENGAIIKMI